MPSSHSFATVTLYQLERPSTVNAESLLTKLKALKVTGGGSLHHHPSGPTGREQNQSRFCRRVAWRRLHEILLTVFVTQRGGIRSGLHLPRIPDGHQGHHDDDGVAKIGCCPRCRRAGGLLYKGIIKKKHLMPLAEEAQARSPIL